MTQRKDFKGGSLLKQQKTLYTFAEELERARKASKPVREGLSQWLEQALKRIACGEDVDHVFGTRSGKKGVRKDAFKQQLMRKVMQGYVAAVVDDENPENQTVANAVESAAEVGVLSSGSIRKNWNTKGSNKSPTFTLGGD